MSAPGGALLYWGKTVLDRQPRPLVVTFVALYNALFALHQGEKRWVDSLHDVWKLGAPSPDSRILLPGHYDERLVQPGNVEKRIVFPTPLAAWITQVSAARGYRYSLRQALALIDGRADPGLENARSDTR
jgi:hypothetical protein